MFQKKTFLTLFLLLILLILASCGTNAPAANPKPQKSSLDMLPRGTGNNPESGIDNKPVPMPEGHTESILPGNGLIYVGSDNGKVYAFDASSGSMRWQKPEQATSLLASDGETLYAGNPNSHMLYALNALDGTERWRYTTVGDFSTVELGTGMIFINVFLEPASSVIYALMATDGTVLWHYTTASIASALVAVTHNQVYEVAVKPAPGDSSNAARAFTALNANNGHILWQITPDINEGNIGSGIAEDQGIVYLSTTSGSLYAVQESSGQIIWHVSQPLHDNPMPIFGASTPVIAAGIVYTGNDSTVSAYRANNGQPLWQYSASKTNGMPGPFTIQPLVGNGAIYFVTPLTMGNLIALRASDGGLLWQKSGAEAVPQGLALVNGILVSQIGQVTAWRASDGDQLWTRNTDNGSGPPGPGSPVTLDSTTETLYIGGSNGTFQALRVSDGALLWSYAFPELPVAPAPVYAASITFNQATSYDHALQMISDLGLKTFAPCSASWTVRDDRTLFSKDHLLFVRAMVNSAPLWLERLKALPEVSQAQEEGRHSCPAESIKPNAIPYLPRNQVGAYLGIQFTSTTAYLAAWESLNILGFRLATPCYEQARAQGHKPSWQPMGEEQSFTQTHTLIVATTQFNAVTWRQQVQSAAGVQKVNSLSSSSC